MRPDYCSVRRSCSGLVGLVTLGAVAALLGVGCSHEGNTSPGYGSSGGATGSGSGGTSPGTGGASVGSGGTSGGSGGASAGSGGASGSGSGGASGSDASGGVSGGSGGDSGSGGISGSGGVSGSGGTPVGPALPLPLVVTSFYNNQGWFADAVVGSTFKPGSTTISQGESTAGPCANRVSGAKGQCLKVVYTPPKDVTLLTSGGFVGVFFLTTLKAGHPELNPPANIGEANWGVEPGLNIAPGATQISFQVAGATAGATVKFKAGAGSDLFGVQETPVTTTTTWQGASLSLSGQDYGTSVLGAFAWALADTTKTVTFYLDNILWQ